MKDLIELKILKFSSFYLKDLNDVINDIPYCVRSLSNC